MPNDNDYFSHLYNNDCLQCGREKELRNENRLLWKHLSYQIANAENLQVKELVLENQKLTRALSIRNKIKTELGTQIKVYQNQLTEIENKVKVKLKEWGQKIKPRIKEKI